MAMDDYGKFRDNIRCFRKWKDMTGKEFSAFAGLRNPGRASSLEAGNRGTPTLTEVMLIAKAMNCTTDELLFCVATTELKFVNPKP